MSLKDTLGNEQWLLDNEHALKAIFPEDFTHIINLDYYHINSKLKELGVVFEHIDDINKILIFFEKIGITVREKNRIKRNPKRIFLGET